MQVALIAYILSAAAMSMMICLLAPQAGRALGLIDHPEAKAHSLHTVSTPLVGGLAIIAPWIILVDFDPILAELFTGRDSAFGSSIWISIMVMIFLLIGMLDDRYHLSAYIRLIMMAPLYGMFVFIHPSFAIDTLTSPAVGISLNLYVFAAPFTALCLVALTNTVNMADGRNGLVVGLSFIWCLALTYHVPAQFQIMLYVAMVSLLVTGVFNLRGRLFLGDSGTYALSSMIGLVSLYAHNIPTAQGGLSSPQLAALFAIPGLDMLRLMVSRFARGASPMSGDHDHLHHRLDRSIGWRLGLPVFLLLASMPILVALSGPKMGAPGLIVACGLYSIAWGLTRRHQQRPFGLGAGEAAADV